MIVLTKENAPELVAARRAIEEDNGGHLIGTVYPGERLDLDRWQIPIAWAGLIKPAEAALARLRAISSDDWETFVAGEASEQEAIKVRQGDLTGAHKLLNDWFNGWQPEDAPGMAA